MRKRIKFLNTLVAVMLLALCCGLTACGDDDDDPTGPDVWGTSYTMKMTFSDDFLKVADITAHVAKPDGTFHEEPVTQGTSTWTVTGEKIPSKAGVAFTFVPKKNIAEGTYNLSANGSIDIRSLKNSGIHAEKNKLTQLGITVPADRVAGYLTGKGMILLGGVDKEGNVIDVNSDDIDFGLNGIWSWLADKIGK